MYERAHACVCVWRGVCAVCARGHLCVRAWTRTYARAYVRVHVCLYVCACVYTYVRVRTPPPPPMRVFMRICVYAPVRVWERAYAFSCVRVLLHARLRVRGDSKNLNLKVLAGCNELKTRTWSSDWSLFSDVTSFTLSIFINSDTKEIVHNKLQFFY